MATPRSLEITQKYGGLDPRFISDVLKSPEARQRLSSDQLTDMTTFTKVGYWSNPDRVVWDALQSGQSEVPDIQEYASKVESPLSAAQVRVSLESLAKKGEVFYVPSEESATLL